jgi:hypothetical protein
MGENLCHISDPSKCKRMGILYPLFEAQVRLVHLPYLLFHSPRCYGPGQRTRLHYRLCEANANSRDILVIGNVHTKYRNVSRYNG